MVKVSRKPQKIKVRYFALLREERGKDAETVITPARTVRALYLELQKKYHFSLSTDLLRMAVNEEFKAWNTPLKANDTVVFIPPVAGG